MFIILTLYTSLLVLYTDVYLKIYIGILTYTDVYKHRYTYTYPTDMYILLVYINQEYVYYVYVVYVVYYNTDVYLKIYIGISIPMFLIRNIGIRI